MPYKFDPAKIEKLNSPGRLVDLNPDAMWRVTSPPDNAVFVEIGAGTGVFATQFARRMTGGRVYAADTMPQMIDYMREHLPADVRGTVVPLPSQPTRVPLPDAQADVVFMVNVHHELDDRAATLREAYRLLKPGGVVMLADWRKAETPKGPPIAARIDAADAARELEAAGFADVQQHEDLPYAWLLTARREG